MMTQTHLLVAASLFSSPKRPSKHNFAILIGSFFPDIAVFGLFIWSKLAGIPERQLWREVYFSEPMLTYTAIANSLPVYLVILLAGVLLYKSQASNTNLLEPIPRISIMMCSAICLFALAAITHLIGDFPVHTSDAHPHFWPISDWRFHSPVSYWDDKHYGDYFSLIEAALGVVLSIVLYRRFNLKWVRCLLVLAIFLYVAVPVYFYLQLG